MRSRRSGVSIINFHGLIYAVGGFDGVNRLRHAEAYNPQTNTWRNTNSMSTPRSNFGIEVIDDKLIVVGGFNGQRTCSDVEAYDDTSDEWYTIKEMHICRSALSCCLITGLPHEIIKRYCVPRDLPQGLSEDVSSSINQDEENLISERSDELSSDEEAHQNPGEAEVEDIDEDFDQG
ncbi:unnamed protein product [Clavelina lepadiformis]|uniref:Kelch-like protein 10 n=1 Tax=Clavelina lepadiformis TaxID=159417 RepID=A0ABP0EXW7_CLALP